MTLIDSPETATPAVQARRAYRIVLIDGQRLFRQALRILFATEREFAVVGEAEQAAEAVELVASLQPDVVVTDLHLTDGSAVPLIEQIHARFPKVAIVVLTSARARDVAAAVRKAGALGYRTREIAQMLGVSVRAVHRQRERLRLALHLNSTAELTRFAVREGFTEGAAEPVR